jgi:inosine-uridine nucleoside N-ribohydrolase
VTLLAIGPMTNVGLLFATYPETAKALKALVLMCGRFGNGIPRLGTCEWNALNDPYATAIVYNAPVPVHRSVGLDVTMQVQMDVKRVAERFTHPVLCPVYDFSKVWFENTEIMTFHDPLAAAVIFDEDICTWQHGRADIVTERADLMGMTLWTPDKDGPHEAAMAVDAERFFAHYFSVFD